MIELRGIGKVYHASDGENRALDGVNLTIQDGDIFGIIGESGAGKSTLVCLLNLLERPTEGRVLIDGVDITDYKGRQLRELRAGIGMIFQNFSLFQQRTVLQKSRESWSKAWPKWTRGLSRRPTASARAPCRLS